MGAEDTLMGVIPLAVEAKLVTNILDSTEKKRKKKKGGLEL